MNKVPFPRSTSELESAQADLFMQMLVEEDPSLDIFDRDISMLERLS